MIYSVDESVGRIVALLDEFKLAEKTLVIFSSDNGGVGGYKREGIKVGKEITDNAPLAGWQRDALRRRHSRALHLPLARQNSQGHSLRHAHHQRRSLPDAPRNRRVRHRHPITRSTA